VAKFLDSEREGVEKKSHIVCLILHADFLVGNDVSIKRKESKQKKQTGD